MATPIKWGSEFLANTVKTGDQVDAAVAALADGRFVVTWTDKSGAANAWDVRAQVFNADGSKAGAEFLVNSTTIDFQSDPAVAGLPDGRFAVVWRDTSGPGNDADLTGQIFNVDGSKWGGEFAVNTTLAGNQQYAAISALDAGRFIVTWANDTNDDIKAQIFDSNGAKAGVEFQLNTTATGKQYSPSIAGLGNGNFIASWTQADGNVDVTRAQLFDHNGNKIGAEFQVATNSAGMEVAPAVVPLGDLGHFAIAYTDNSSGSHQVKLEVYLPDGTKAGFGDIQVNTDQSGDNYSPVMVGRPDGSFLVAWEHNGPGPGANDSIQGQMFDANGVPSGSEFFISPVGVNWQSAPALAMLADGRIVASWEDAVGTLGDNSGWGIHSQIIDPREGGVQIVGHSLNDDLIGTTQKDYIYGGPGNDHLSGDAGDDSFFGGAGADILSGGTGFDTADYHSSPFAVTVNLITNVNTGGDAQGDTLYSIERVIGSAYDDTLTGNGLDNTLEGGKGQDILVGGGGNDTLIGGDDTDYLIAGSGNDVLIGGAGAPNKLWGGTNDDIYAVESAGDTVVEFAGEGYDQVQTWLSAYTLTAEVEKLVYTGGGNFTGIGNGSDNTLIGGSGADYLIGLAGKDVLIGGAGAANTLQGGTGDDIYAVEAVGDTIVEFAGEGHDQVQTWLATFTLSANVEDLTFTGGGPHTGTGNILNNVMTGGASSDIFTGAGGADRFVYKGPSGADTITDFDAVDGSAGHDLIDLTGRGLNFANLAVTAINGGTMIGLDGGDTIFLQGVTAANVNAFDFLF